MNRISIEYCLLYLSEFDINITELKEWRGNARESDNNRIVHNFTSPNKSDDFYSDTVWAASLITEVLLLIVRFYV